MAIPGQKLRKIPKCSKLKIEVVATFTDGTSKVLQALVDTGAEVNLVNTKLDPALKFQPSPKPVRLGVANSHTLEGGKREAILNLQIKGREVDTGN